MPDLARFRALTKREQALVAIAVLLDGHDATDFLSSDRDRRAALERAANDVAELAPDLRITLLGTLLRSALNELRNES